MKPSSRPEILVLQTAFVGDLLLSIPLLKQLRVSYPSAHLVLLCRKGLGDFFLKSELVNETVEVEKSASADAYSWSAAREKLASRELKIIICPHQSFRSSLFVARLNAHTKIGYRRWFNRFIFTDRVARPMQLPEALRQLALLTPLNSIWKERLDTAKQIEFDDLASVPAWADMSIPQLVSLKELRATDEPPTVVLAPGSVWNTKKWTLEGFAKVAAEFTYRGWRVIAIGAKAEINLCTELHRLVPSVEVMAGETSLYESTEIIAKATLIICNDSGAMHMAAAAKTPTVAVFGPTVLEFGYRPWQDLARVVQVPRSELPCRPCGRHGSQVCPIGTHACMKRISAAQVLMAAREITPQYNHEH